MSFADITNFGLGVGSAIRDGATERVGSAIMNGATESVASLSRGVWRIVVGMLSTATNTSLTDEEPCVVTLEEGRQAEREFLDNSINGEVKDCDFCGDQGCVYCDSDDFEEVPNDIAPTGFLPFDPERVVEEGKRDLHRTMYHIVMHLTAQNHPVVRDTEYLTRLNEIINAWYFTPPEETCLRWSEVSVLLSQYQVINFSDPDDDVLMLLRRTY